MVPGTASCFTRKFGRYMEWITSVEASWTMTGTPTGTLRSSTDTMSSGVPNLPSTPAYRACHDHWCAFTSIRTAPSAASARGKFQKYPCMSPRVWTKRYPSTPTRMAATPPTTTPIERPDPWE